MAAHNIPTDLEKTPPQTVIMTKGPTTLLLPRTSWPRHLCPSVLLPLRQLYLVKAVTDGQAHRKYIWIVVSIFAVLNDPLLSTYCIYFNS